MCLCEGGSGIVYRSAEGGWQGVTVAVKQLKMSEGAGAKAWSSASVASEPSWRRFCGVIFYFVRPLRRRARRLEAAMRSLAWRARLLNSLAAVGHWSR